jgi:hypothetical protein
MEQPQIRVLLAHVALRVIKATRGHRVFLVLRQIQAQQVILAERDTLAQRAHKVFLVHPLTRAPQDKLGQQALQATQVQWVHRETRALPVNLQTQALLVTQAPEGLLVLPVVLQILAQQDIQE